MTALARMTRHYAYGLDMDDLDVVVVDDSKPMQAILRSTLLSFRVRRVRTFDTAEAALEMMRLDPPNFVITDWLMKPMSGLALLRTLRQRKMAPLCFLPVVVCTAHGTRTLIDRVLRDGAQHVVAKPLSPSGLYDRLMWTLRDDRQLVMSDSGRYVIEGVADTLDEKARKWQQIGIEREIVAPKSGPRRDLAAPVQAAETSDTASKPRNGFATVRPKRSQPAA
jgi:two-component system chemotaxis response regulator CheY